MSLFGMMNDLEDDPIFGHHMRSIRQMSSMFNSIFADPFGMPGGGMESLTAGPAFGMRHNALMPFMPPAMNMNRLLNPSGFGDMTPSYCSSSVISMTSGPDGPQVYQATSSTRTGPGGIKETRKTVQDSRTGTKKMAIGHHIGERAHIIEREQNLSTGVQEERQDFINLDDEEAEDFDREFHTKARSSMSLSTGRRSEQLALPSTQPAPSQRILSITEVTDDDSTCERCGNPSDTTICANCNHGQGTSDRQQRSHPAQHHSNQHGVKSSRGNRSMTQHGGYGNAPVSGRRSIRSPAASPLANGTTSVHPHPYQVSGRKSRSVKGPSSSTTTTHYQ
ncbi:myeloid leukemia factor isoform X1 [Anopheles aquasalis]|uniref:myeloid leukemia factor isoform X1 n=1 Tax=Anopheles aquasalis TaxID=42839 RepID=UPI00215B4D34|nr:myeloid leukemia factor isoform X1 [Anopheles aquasalis]